MKFSVLLSVYHKERPAYLDEALHSIWDGQSLKPDQVVLVSDGPLTEALDSVVARWVEQLGGCLTLMRLPRNLGLAGALNAGLTQCRHDVVARMDTDDIALPERFARQVAFLSAHPEVDVASAWIEERDDSMQTMHCLKKLPATHEELVGFSRTRNPISHPVVIFRKRAVLAVGGYPEVFPEDYALWSLMMVKGYRFANISEVLLYMRTGDDFIGRRGWQFFKGEVKLLKYQKSIGFLKWKDYLLNLGLRAAIRLPPAGVRRMLYRVAR